MYHVSRPTIRQAIDLLIHEGFLYREHGKGTFVMPQKLQKGLLELTSFSEDLIKRGMVPGQKILEMGMVKPSEKICQLLDLGEDQKVLRIKRIRLGDGIPIGIQTSFLALAANQSITHEELEESGSLYKILQEKLHIIPWAADETLEVAAATWKKQSCCRFQLAARCC